MSLIESFNEGTIEGLAKVLGECGSGTDISRVLENRGLVDNSGESTKWRRLYRVFLQTQKDHHCANKVIDFIQSFLTPARFAGRAEEFEAHRKKLNTILAFVGLNYGSNGKFTQTAAATTLDEAEQRVRTIRKKFSGRILHPEVLKYCRAELMQENYFHAVFEATKGLAQRIRELAGVEGDGATLVDKVFSISSPILAFNTLRTETEQSEHKGFAMLLKGCFGAVRNPLAHGPKILWSGEDDAADYLTMISLLHRKLDGCVKTGVGGHTT
ncbi:MAG: TIGR02391 family protein [Puniceicoccaceae bacterium]